MAKTSIGNLLFKIGAIKVCKDDPFWLAAGIPSPYFCNTENLYGGEEAAKDLLDFIDKNKGDKLNFPSMLLEREKSNYRTNPTYRAVIGKLCECIEAGADLRQINFVSGGERRDWPFSLIVANMIRKDHITIYKDGSTVLTTHNPRHSFEWGKDIKYSGNFNGLHVTDLVTEASSYKLWIPAVNNCGGNMIKSLSVVERGNQGGNSWLREQGIQADSLITIDIALFEEALELGLINARQCEMLINYLQDPEGSMDRYVEDHPDFMTRSLTSNDPKIYERSHKYLKRKEQY